MPAPAEASLQTHPWQRWGWVMGGVWLVFLAFPVAGVVDSGESRPRVVAGVALFVLFAAVYIHGFRTMARSASDAEVVRSGVTHLVALVLICVVIHLLVGPASVGGGPYLVALAMFVLPMWAAVSLTAAVVLTTVVVTAFSDALTDTWYLPGIVLLVAVVTGVVRAIERRSILHDELAAELTVSAERDRLARDVHDVIGHTLTAMSLKADVAERLVVTDPERARREIAEVGVLSRQALAEVRAAVGGIRSARLDDEIASAERVLASAGIAADMPTDLTVVDPRHRVVLAWVLREAVTNVVRHSEASVCRVALGPSSLTVEDDGRGPSGLREGNGLRGVRERVDAAGGVLRVLDASPGTRLVVTL
ncbi:sensor histidine kinase [Knoellia locipacati]|uniref:Histidine kinase n=1 Tax=Knoellia locipacati TaxID=882824 RepID=A0A512T474_9MICO|nr:sensor histidine kinase [Knoellia locipacati]GEQ14963.1 histidine kinase [Knoellia locipacati]